MIMQRTANSQPLLTIVSITRNSGSALAATAASVLAQNEGDFEYLIVDGASTDGSLEAATPLFDERVRVISERDSGISDAMNKGIRLANGQWIAHLHAGDRYEPNAITHVIRAISSNPEVDIWCGSMIREDPNGDLVCFARPDRLRNHMDVPHPSVFARTSLWRELGGFDVALRNAMDYDLLLRAELAGAKFGTIPDQLTRFASGGQSEQSVRATLRETHLIRRRLLRGGWSRTPLYYAGLVGKAAIRSALEVVGLSGLVSVYRSRVSRSRKIPA
jgi:glycosyltransferase involved in cell wall biosynthesis